MKKTAVILILFAAAATVLGCYAFGMFDSDVITVSGKAYSDFTYSGKIKNGSFDGIGLIVFDNGYNYNGNFTNGYFDGNGVLHNLSGGWVFNGAYNNRQISHGTFKYDSGKSIDFERGDSIYVLTEKSWMYEGKLNDFFGQIGEGKFTFSDGSYYEGNFINGKADGEGSYKSSSGRVIYEGGFKNGKFDGRGVYRGNDWSYEGGFRDGLLHGEGTVTKGNGIVRGIWEKGIQTILYE